MKAIKVALAWIWVAVPLTWGVWHSVRKSMPLFQSPPPPPAAVTPAAR
jgi:hypothetical protein